MTYEERVLDFANFMRVNATKPDCGEILISLINRTYKIAYTQGRQDFANERGNNLETNLKDDGLIP